MMNQEQEPKIKSSNKNVAGKVFDRALQDEVDEWDILFGDPEIISRLGVLDATAIVLPVNDKGRGRSNL